MRTLLLLPILALVAASLEARPQDAQKEYDLTWNSHFVRSTELDDWAQAVSALSQAMASQDPSRLVGAVEKVASDDSPRAVNALLKAALAASSNQYWIIISGLSGLSSEKAVECLVEEILKGKVPALRRDLLMTLRLNEKGVSTRALARLVVEGSPEVQVSALDEIVDRERVSIVPQLIQLAEKDPKEERELTRRLFKAICSLSKKEPPGAPGNWRQWWEGLEAQEKQESGDEPKRQVGQTVVESIRRSRATDYEALKRIGKGEILAIEGVYDNVQDVLTKLEIPHEVMTLERADKYLADKASDCIAVCINCGSGSGEWPSGVIERIRKYVCDGGYLFITDLGMTHVVRRAFPGYLEFGKGPIREQTVGIIPWKGSTGNPFLRGVNTFIDGKWSDKGENGKSGRMTWVIDEGSASISYDSTKVIPLVEAPELAARKKPTTVAVSFAYGCDAKVWQDSIANGGVYEEIRKLGGGKVLCILSHFIKQQRGEDGFALQNMLINFLIEAKDRKMMRGERSVPRK